MNKISQFKKIPLDQHQKAIKRILRYLKGTINHGFVLKSCTNINLTSFANADCGSDPDDKDLQVATVYIWGQILSHGAQKKQTIVSRSSKRHSLGVLQVLLLK